MNKNKLIILLLLAQCAFIISSCKKEQTIIPITLTPSLLSFGSVDIYQTSTLSFNIENTGTQPLTINEVSTSDGFSVDWTEGVIQKGQSQKVNVSFYPLSDKQYAGQISISSNAGTHYITISGKGHCDGNGYLEFENKSYTTHKVLIDNILYGTLSPGESHFYKLPSGSHTFSQPGLDGTGGCNAGTCIIVACQTQSFYCDHN